MDVKNKKYMSIVTALAETVEPTGGAKVAAAIVYKGSIFFGINSKKTHPFQARFAKNPDAITMHAEIAAIHQALKTLTLDELSKATLYVARVKRPYKGAKEYIIGDAMPCEGCARAIKEFAIKKVHFTQETIRVII